MKNRQTYTVPTDLLQAMVSVIEGLPSRQVRPLVNAIEKLTVEQDREFEKTQLEEFVKAAKASETEQKK